jgi:predicted nucleic acid-binding protein
VRDWAATQPPERCFLSTVTLAEIRFGIEQLGDAGRQAEITAWLDGVLRPWFGGRILDIEEDVILEWRRLVAKGRAIGVTFSQPDLFMAATARHHGLGLSTRNARHFRGTGTTVFDPWTGQLHAED